MELGFSQQWCAGRTRGNKQELEGRCKLVMKVTFLTIGAVGQWSQLLGKSVQDPSLEVFNTHSKIPIPGHTGEGATSSLASQAVGQP